MPRSIPMSEPMPKPMQLNALRMPITGKANTNAKLQLK